MQHNKRKKIFAWAVAVVLLFSLAAGVYAQNSGGSGINSEVWKLWRKGFEHFENAELKMVSRQYAEAISHYNHALEAFRKVRKLNPRWNRDVIEYRITRAERRVLLARERSGIPAERITRTKSLPARRQVTQPRQQSRENIELRRELAETRRALSTVQQQAKSRKAAHLQVENLLAERARLEQEVATLRLRYENLEKVRSSRTREYESLLARERNRSLTHSKMINDQNRVIGTLRKEVQTLVREKDLLESRRKQLEKTIADDRTLAATQRRELQKEIASLRDRQQKNGTALENLRTSLAKEKQESERLQKELTDLRTSGNASTLAVKQTREELARLRENGKALEKALEKARQEKEELVKKSQALSAEQARLKNVLSANIKQVNDYGTMNDQLLKEMGELKKSASEFAAGNKKLQKAFDLLKKERDMFAARINAGFPEAGRLEELKKENAKLSAGIKTAENNLKELRLAHAKRLEALEADRLSLKNMVAKLEDARKKALADPTPTASQLKTVEALRKKALAEADAKAKAALAEAGEKARKRLADAKTEAENLLAEARKKAQAESALIAQQKKSAREDARKQLLALEEKNKAAGRLTGEAEKLRKEAQTLKLQAEKQKADFLAEMEREKKKIAQLKADAEKVLADARSEKLKAEKTRAELAKRSLAVVPAPLPGKSSSHDAEVAKWKKEQEKTLKELTAKLTDAEKTLKELTIQKNNVEKTLALETAQKTAARKDLTLLNREKQTQAELIVKLRKDLDSRIKSAKELETLKAALLRDLEKEKKAHSLIAGKLADKERTLQLLQKEQAARKEEKKLDKVLLSSENERKKLEQENALLKKEVAEGKKLRTELDLLKKEKAGLQADAVRKEAARAKEKQEWKDKIILFAKVQKEEVTNLQNEKKALEEKASKLQQLYNDTLVRHAREQEKTYKAGKEFRTKQEQEIAILRKKASSLLLALGDANVAKESVEKRLKRSLAETAKLKKAVADLQKDHRDNKTLEETKKLLSKKEQQNKGLLQQMKVLRKNLADSARRLLVLQERHSQISKVFTNIAAERDRLKGADKKNRELHHALAALRSDLRKQQAREKTLVQNSSSLEKKNKALEAKLEAIRNFDDPFILRVKEIVKANRKGTGASAQTLQVKDGVIDALIDELKAERKKQREAFARITVSHNEALRQKRLNDDMTEELKDLERKLQQARGRYSMLLSDVEDGNLKLKDLPRYKEKALAGKTAGRISVTVPGKAPLQAAVSAPAPSAPVRIPETAGEGKNKLKAMYAAMKEGEKAEKEGDLSMALWHYWQAADAGEKDPLPYMALARINIMRKDAPAAEKAYRKALELGGKRNEAWEKQIRALK